MRNFQNVIDKAKESCKNSKSNLDEQLVEVNKLSKRNDNAVANIQDYNLSRYILSNDPVPLISDLCSTNSFI